jgi:hypothetical protein
MEKCAKLAKAALQTFPLAGRGNKVACVVKNVFQEDFAKM